MKTFNLADDAAAKVALVVNEADVGILEQALTSFTQAHGLTPATDRLLHNLRTRLQ